MWICLIDAHLERSNHHSCLLRTVRTRYLLHYSPDSSLCIRHLDPCTASVGYWDRLKTPIWWMWCQHATGDNKHQAATQWRATNNVVCVPGCGLTNVEKRFFFTDTTVITSFLTTINFRRYNDAYYICNRISQTTTCFANYNVSCWVRKEMCGFNCKKSYLERSNGIGRFSRTIPWRNRLHHSPASIEHRRLPYPHTTDIDHQVWLKTPRRIT